MRTNARQTSSSQAGEADLQSHVLKSLSVLQLRKGDQMQAVATMQSSLQQGAKPNILSRLFKRSPKQVGQ